MEEASSIADAKKRLSDFNANEIISFVTFVLNTLNSFDERAPDEIFNKFGTTFSSSNMRRWTSDSIVWIYADVSGFNRREQAFEAKIKELEAELEQLTQMYNTWYEDIRKGWKWWPSREQKEQIENLNSTITEQKEECETNKKQLRELRTNSLHSRYAEHKFKYSTNKDSNHGDGVLAINLMVQMCKEIKKRSDTVHLYVMRRKLKLIRTGSETQSLTNFVETHQMELEKMLRKLEPEGILGLINMIENKMDDPPAH